MARKSTPGAYRLAWDREAAFRTFMTAVADIDAVRAEDRRGGVLESLRDLLLPIYRQLRPSPRGVNTAFHDWLVANVGGEAGDDHEPEAFDFVKAIWDWALDPFHLVAPLDELHRLDSSHPGDFLAPEMAYHRDFLFCVYHTLRAMDDGPGGTSPPRWVFHGEPGTGPVDPLVDDMRGTATFTRRDEEGRTELFTTRHTHPDRYEIVYRPEKWLPGVEAGGSYVERTVAEFKRLLAEMLEAQARQQCGVGNLVPQAEDLDPEHAKMLAKHQVFGETLSGIGRDYPEYEGSEDKHTIDEVGKQVRKAAEALLGPRYEVWFRKPRPGRPRGAGKPPR